MNLFEILNERYVLPPKPRLFESFAGIGCQRMAFDRLGIDYESVGISEIDKYAIKSYMAIHGETKNYGDITKIHGYQLPTIDVFTYSFPCTDLSKAGKQKGLNATRSGLVYEVLRILQELKDLHNLPSVLIMENVVDLVQTKFIREFNEIQLELESLGYSNYVETMNAKDYGVAQNRDRVFMVSILGDYYYEFPKKIKLEKRLKDYLESEVDEKYYLSEKAMEFALNRPANYENKIDADISNTLRTNYGNAYANECYVSIAGNVNPSGNGMNGNVYQGDLSPTLTTNKGEGIKIVEPCISVKEATEQGYAEAFEGDSINLAQPNSKTRRGRVGKQVSQTLTTMNQIAVVEPNVLTPKRTEHGKEVRKDYENGSHEESRHTMTELVPRDDGISNALTTVLKDNMVVEPIICASRGRENGQEIEVNKSGLSNALTTVQKDNMVVEPVEVNRFYKQAINTFEKNDCDYGDTISAYNESVDKSGCSPTITTRPEGLKTAILPITKELRIRKLTPLECWRLMGIDDECFYKASEVNSNSQLYRQAGNGIVIDVFAAIIKNFERKL